MDFMTTVYPFSDDYIKQDKTPCQLESSPTGSLNTRSQSNRAALGCVGTGDLQHGCAANKSWQLHDGIMSIWTKTKKRRIKAVPKPKEGPSRYEPGLPKKGQVTVDGILLCFITHPCCEKH